ncbi:MAG: hypothetical protein HUJ60_03135 [Bacilli bacterium]|nr:hypothetical protein [Bacilli bacterium]
MARQYEFVCPFCGKTFGTPDYTCECGFTLNRMKLLGSAPSLNGFVIEKSKREIRCIRERDELGEILDCDEVVEEWPSSKYGEDCCPPPFDIHCFSLVCDEFEQRFSTKDHCFKNLYFQYTDNLSRESATSEFSELLETCFKGGKIALSRYDELSRLAFPCQSKVAANLLILDAIGCVYDFSFWRIGRGAKFEELFVEGLQCLLKAYTKFEYKRGFRFGTYASWCVNQGVQNRIGGGVYYRKHGIDVPAHIRESLGHLFKLMQKTRELFSSIGKHDFLRTHEADDFSETHWSVLERFRDPENRHYRSCLEYWRFSEDIIREYGGRPIASPLCNSVNFVILSEETVFVNNKTIRSFELASELLGTRVNVLVPLRLLIKGYE